MSRTHYRGLLERFFGIYSVLEPRVLRTPGLSLWLEDVAERQRLPALIADLRLLNSNLDSLPLCCHLPRLENLADAFGCLYVLEGSTLGAQVISQRVQANLGFTVDQGCTFFAGANQDVRTKWAGFTEAIQRFADADAQGCSAMVETAKRTFETFIAWFSAGVPPYPGPVSD